MGLTFQPDDTKEIGFYLYDSNLTFDSHEPYVKNVIASEDFSVDTTTSEEYTWTYSDVHNRSELDISITSYDGLIEVYFNTTDDDPIVVNSLETLNLRLSVHNANKILLLANSGTVTGNIVIKKRF
jgi:hypothetical protein